MISNGNRTEWSPIRTVIIQVINKIGRPRSGSPFCLITSSSEKTVPAVKKKPFKRTRDGAYCSVT